MTPESVANRGALDSSLDNLVNNQRSLDAETKVLEVNRGPLDAEMNRGARGHQTRRNHSMPQARGSLVSEANVGALDNDVVRFMV